MKKSLFSVIMLFIAWAVSASTVSAPMAIVRLEDAGSPNSRVHRSFAEVCPVGMQTEMCPTGHGFQPDGIGVLPHATRLVTLPGHTSAKLRCTRLLNESVSCGHVGDSLEHSAFPGGYFTPEGVFYYITDWQGNNIAVFSDKGELVQQTTYYPYGEPTIEPTGQRYLFGGKEREHAGGRNSYDYGPRNLGPSGNWDSADRKSESFYPFSPFSYCGGDPINRVDRDGKFWETVWDVGNILWDAGCAIKAHIDGDHEKAKEYWKDAAYDTGAALLPFVPAGVSKGAKFIRGVEEASETAIKGSSKIKNADKIQEGIDWGHTVKKEFEGLGYQVADEVSVVPLNGKGNIKGNRSRVDLLVRDTDGKFIIIECKLTNKTKPSSGQTSVMNHIGTSGGKVEIRSNLDEFGLKKGQTIEVKEYIRINKYD